MVTAVKAPAPAPAVVMTPDEFTLRAIVALRDVSKSKGIHTVWDKFNEIYRMQFPEQGKDGPIVCVDRMAAAGTIVKQWARGGARIFLPNESPASQATAAALAKVLGI